MLVHEEISSSSTDSRLREILPGRRVDGQLSDYCEPSLSCLALEVSAVVDLVDERFVDSVVSVKVVKCDRLNSWTVTV